MSGSAPSRQALLSLGRVFHFHFCHASRIDSLRVEVAHSLLRSTPTTHPQRTMSRAAPAKQPEPQAQDPADGTPVKEVAPFLKSLRVMLDTEDPRILRWTPDGTAFEIHDMTAMTGYVLPKYFKHRKYASFQRQLNYFHFRKWTKSRAVVCTFSNQFFQRDQPALTWRITRKRALSPAKHSSPRSDKAVKQETRTSDLKLTKLDPFVTVQTTLSQPDILDEDASLAWIDALYPELDLDLLEDSDPTGTDCFFSTSKLLTTLGSQRGLRRVLVVRGLQRDLPVPRINED